MKGRDFSSDKYRYGFGNQEKDNEVTGINGTDYTSPFWEYDARLGRRWNVDIVVKHHLSCYATFNNNPIIFVDPEGSTDYYNGKGKWIGTNGINDGAKQMVLTKPTERVIKRATKDGQNISMNTKYYKDIIDVPSKGEITANEKVFTNTASSNKEEGYSAGNPAGGGEKIISEPVGTQETKFSPQSGYDDIKAQGGSGSYDTHSHPAGVIYDAPTDKFSVSQPYSSPGDRTTTPQYESAYGSTQANIVLGYDLPLDLSKVSDTDLKKAKANPGTFIPISPTYLPKVITFYNGKGDIKSFMFGTFKKIVEKIQNDDSSKHTPKGCSPSITPSK